MHQSLLPLGAKGTIWMAAGEDRFKSPQIDQRLSKNRRVVWSEVQGWCVCVCVVRPLSHLSAAAQLSWLLFGVLPVAAEATVGALSGGGTGSFFKN